MPRYNGFPRSGSASIYVNAPVKTKPTSKPTKPPVKPVAKQISATDLLGTAPKATTTKKTKTETPSEPVLPREPHFVTEDELKPDGTVLLSFTIPGQPYTKKTSQRVIRGRILPSKQYCDYEDRCEEHILSFWVGDKRTPKEWKSLLVAKRLELKKTKETLKGDVWLAAPSDWTTNRPMDFGLSICMRVYLHTWQVGDATGYMQSIADIIEKFGVIENDSWLHWDWQGEHWLGGVDKENPRVEVTLRRYRHPKEEYRANQELEAQAKKERADARAAKTATKITPTETPND